MINYMHVKRGRSVMISNRRNNMYVKRDRSVI